MQITVEPGFHILGTTHVCNPVSVRSNQENGSVHIVETCSCGQIRRSEQFPWGESVGQWITPFEEEL